MIIAKLHLLDSRSVDNQLEVIPADRYLSHMYDIPASIWVAPE